MFDINLKIHKIFLIHVFVIILFYFINTIYLHPNDFKGGDTIKTNLDMLYHTIITHASIGYGDISPQTQKSRTIATIHVFITFMLIVTIQP
jgi:hypothetical protein